MKAKYESKIQVKGYCESCRGEYLSGPGEGCPVCNTRAKKQEKTTKKGAVKNE